MSNWIDKSMDGTLRKREHFSKALLIKHLAKKAFYLSEEHHFTNTTGWAQVEGKGEEKNRAYGEYIGMVHVATIFDLEKDFWTEFGRLRREREETLLSSRILTRNISNNEMTLEQKQQPLPISETELFLLKTKIKIYEKGLQAVEDLIDNSLGIYGLYTSTGNFHHGTK